MTCSGLAEVDACLWEGCRLALSPIEEGGSRSYWLVLTPGLDSIAGEGPSDVPLDGEAVSVRAALSSWSDVSIAEDLGCQTLLASV